MTHGGKVGRRSKIRALFLWCNDAGRQETLELDVSIVQHSLVLSVVLRMDGWMHGLMDGWTDGWMDAFVLQANSWVCPSLCLLRTDAYVCPFLLLCVCTQTPTCICVYTHTHTLTICGTLACTFIWKHMCMDPLVLHAQWMLI